eukprot:3536252-Pleurochrysis_carterae.AAC.3
MLGGALSAPDRACGADSRYCDSACGCGFSRPRQRRGAQAPIRESVDQARGPIERSPRSAPHTRSSQTMLHSMRQESEGDDVP